MSSINKLTYLFVQNFFFKINRLNILQFITTLNSFSNYLLHIFLYLSVYKKILYQYHLLNRLNLFNLLMFLYNKKRYFFYLLEKKIVSFICKKVSLLYLNSVKIAPAPCYREFNSVFSNEYCFVMFYNYILNNIYLLLEDRSLQSFLNYYSFINLLFIYFFYCNLVILCNLASLYINESYVTSIYSSYYNNNYISYYSCLNSLFFYMNNVKNNGIYISFFSIRTNIIDFFDIYEFVINFDNRSMLIFNSNFFYLYMLTLVKNKYRIMLYTIFIFFKLWSYFSNYFKLIMLEEYILFGKHKKEVFLFHLSDE